MFPISISGHRGVWTLTDGNKFGFWTWRVSAFTIALVWYCNFTFLFVVYYEDYFSFVQFVTIHVLYFSWISMKYVVTSKQQCKHYYLIISKINIYYPSFVLIFQTQFYRTCTTRALREQWRLILMWKFRKYRSVLNVSF